MSKDAQPQIAVWLFIMATFIFAMTPLYFPDADNWLRITVIVAGLALVFVGGIQLGREISAQKKNNSAEE